MGAISKKCADVLRAEAWGLDLEQTTHGISVFAMRKDGTLYELGHIAHEAVMQDPSGATRAIERIKFAAHQATKEPR